ncbi:hypothetical protein FN846DRAFT_972955 [Sphaerosporella brunnea]|uniref:Uncharacterized protein n=1 Tax=Sphaerosporella brunnea TaxID=1250544 RepID=A0A5J5EHX6_9PEZI|nr:hypothetical protein FN846DRAFT_972955 [Sphaerosporella brunnea]
MQRACSPANAPSVVGSQFGLGRQPRSRAAHTRVSVGEADVRRPSHSHSPNSRQPRLAIGNTERATSESSPLLQKQPRLTSDNTKQLIIGPSQPVNTSVAAYGRRVYCPTDSSENSQTLPVADRIQKSNDMFQPLFLGSRKQLVFTLKETNSRHHCERGGSFETKMSCPRPTDRVCFGITFQGAGSRDFRPLEDGNLDYACRLVLAQTIATETVDNVNRALDIPFNTHRRSERFPNAIDPCLKSIPEEEEESQIRLCRCEVSDAGCVQHY